jgi:hypothetical protein
MWPAFDPAGHRVPRMKPTCLLHTWRPHQQRHFTLVLHLHQHQSSRNLHLQYLAKNQSTQLKDRYGEPERGGSEWEPIKIPLEGDGDSNKTNTTSNTRLRLTTQVGQAHAATDQKREMTTLASVHSATSDPRQGCRKPYQFVFRYDCSTK